MAGKEMSREGFEKLKEQYDNLILVERPRIIAKLKNARADGDLSENADYDEAKDEQSKNEAMIADLKYQIENAIIVEHLSNDEVGIGSKIRIRKKGSDKEEEFQIVGSNEMNFREHKISNESPIGMAVMKKKVGDVFIVNAPIGEIEYELLAINR